MVDNSSSARVSLKNVVKKFGDLIVIKNIDLDIAPGSLTTILGPSGCGKTTILRLIAGLELPTSGQILIGEEDVSVLSASRRDVAMVFQSYALFPHMNVGENVGYGLKIQGVGTAERTERVETALGAVGLTGLSSRFIDQLSGGQQQRVAVARALILEPKVMLFDEPLSNLDTKLRRHMRDDIRRLQQETGITSVYVTHDQSEALSVSDQVVVMNEGTIAQTGTPKALYQKPNSTFVATFMGDANIIEGHVVDDDGQAVLNVGSETIRLHRATGEAGLGPAQAAVRPEAITLHPADGPHKGEMLKGRVTSLAYVGSANEYTVDWNGQELFCVVPVVLPTVEVGADAFISIDPMGISPIHEEP